MKRRAKESLAKVQIDKTFTDGFGFSPALLDAALQSLGIFAKEGELALPFAVAKVEFHGTKALNPEPTQAWVNARQISNDADTVQKFDVDLCDPQGRVFVSFKSFSTRGLSVAIRPATDTLGQELCTLKPSWISTAPPCLQEQSNQATEQLTWVADGEQADPLALFQRIKSLLNDGYGSKPFALTLITIQTQRVHFENATAQGAGLIGLSQSLAQEYPRWDVRIVDIQKDAFLSGKVPWQEIAALSPGFYALRENQWYTFEVAAHQYQNIGKPSYQKGGVYLVLGGAGGLGQVWSEWMIRHYAAQLIWVGRSAQNTEIQTALARLGQLGKTPLYFSADAADEVAMRDTLHRIKETFPTINGVVHSILHLEDQSLANMTDEQFLRSYTAKQQTGCVLLNLFKDETLDFILFFSSLQSFSPAPGQSNYAAGCHYLDALALSYQDQLPIKLINWGYWGSVGIVQDDFYHKKMQQAGIGSIEIEEGMQALAKFMSSSQPQLGVVKMQQAQLALATKQQSFSSEDDISTSLPTPSSISYEHDAKLSTQKILNTLCKALHSAGWYSPVQREQALAALPDYYQTWWSETATYLTSANLLKDGFLVDEQKDSSFEKDSSELLDSCLEQLPLILSGKKPATDVIFPNGSMHLVEAVYQNNSLADYANQVQLEKLKKALSQKQLSILRV
ncbi:MAG: SDR family oxidoreductase, partial [Psychrosphaera sp.]|nr:SDR family oxidoreductase [Psychrosphaera sp.]